MSTNIHALAVFEKGGTLKPFDFNPGPLGHEQVEIAVTHCGICHSDLSMIDSAWFPTPYPLVPGHEVVGKIVAAGEHAKKVKVGDTVGLGWFAGSCMSCSHCLSGDQNLCLTAEQTIVGRHGGFADRVRCHWSTAIPLPSELDVKSSGPLLCGGITVFNPIVQFNVKPTDRVGVIGIGGLGHMALKFLNKWGCEVYAFSSSESKKQEILNMGAHQVVNSRNEAELKKIAGSLDFILNTVNVSLNWDAYMATLAPRGRLHTVGAVDAPVNLTVFPMLLGQKSFSGSPLGSPSTAAKMLDFCARHEIAPTIETYPMSKANEALEHLRAGKARYRIVLENDLAQ
jgi:uncharacterized zinc-type alcohol dehydrogenase-like protein